MKHFFACKSSIHGLGMCAGENIKKGEVIADIKGEMKFKVNSTLDDVFANPDWVGVEKDMWIDPEKPYKFLNHSCNANTGVQEKITLTALKDIAEGEEIVIDYSTIEADTRWHMDCGCGAINCRHVIKSIFDLSEEDFKRYDPYIPTAFRKMYQEKLIHNSDKSIE